MQSLTHTSGDQAGKSRVDLVLSCVDNYEARMVVNQVGPSLLPVSLSFLSPSPFSLLQQLGPRPQLCGQLRGLHGR